MRAIHGPTGGAWLLTAVLVASACHSERTTPRSAGLDRQLQELALATERDSLLMEVAANARLLSEHDVARICGISGRPKCQVDDGMQMVAREHHYVVLTIGRGLEMCPRKPDGTLLERCTKLRLQR